MKKSSNWRSKVPSYVKPASLEAASRASVGVLPGWGLAARLVPSQRCVPPDAVVMLRGPEMIGAS